MTTPVIEAENLQKSYGETRALRGVTFSVPAGTVLGVLGPNGAGKTTAVRILTTLAIPDGGHGRVAGHDVVTEAAAVRRSIGVTAQDATLDAVLTGRQNLAMVGELSGLRRRDAKRRADELLERFDLVQAADRILKTYSGGMRRRLDLAASLVTTPPVLFLDEPTTGLDPASRSRMWQVIRDLVGDGTTLLLTTQYLEEADELADRIIVIDHGTVIAEGTAAELKARIGGSQLTVTLTTPRSDAASALAHLVEGRIHVSQDGRRLQAPVSSTPGLATTAIRALDAQGIVVDDIEIRPPSLDDVFFALTGRPAESDDAKDDGESEDADREMELEGVAG